MYVALAILMAFSILTLWVPAYWPVALFEVGTYSLAAITVLKVCISGSFSTDISDRNPESRTKVSILLSRMIGYFPMLAFFIAVVWGLLQLHFGFSVYPYQTRLATLRWLSFFAFYFSLYYALKEDHCRKNLKAMILWFSFSLSIVATLQTFTSNGEIFWLFPSGYDIPVMGPVLNRNHYAILMEVVLPLAVYRLFSSNRDSTVYALICAVMYGSVISSASRAGVILATAELIVVLALTIRAKQIGFISAVSHLLRPSLFFFSFVALAGWRQVWARLTAPDPLQGRSDFILSTLSMIKDHPFRGVGLGAWPYAYPHYARIDLGTFVNQAHCDWIQWFAEGGVAFGLLLVFLLLLSCWPCLKTIWGVGVIAALLHATVEYPFSRPGVGCWIIMMLALAIRSAEGSQIGSPSSVSREDQYASAI